MTSTTRKDRIAKARAQRLLDLDGESRAHPAFALKTLPSTTRATSATTAAEGRAYARFGAGLSNALAGVDQAPYVTYDGTGVRSDQLVQRTISGLETTDRETRGQVDGEVKTGRGWVHSNHCASARRHPANRSPNLQAVHARRRCRG